MYIYIYIYIYIHSTDFCIFTVKSVSKYYTQQHSPSYTCFLDASKAFDKINHFKLFRKLLDCKTLTNCDSENIIILVQ